jgi:isocitrate dehydrogenase kinase/phosphatase
MWRTLPFCLDQSLRGHHHLFDRQLLKATFDEPLELNDEVVATASALFEGLRSEEALEAQRTRIACADERARRLFVRLYFEFLEGWARDRVPTLH